MRVEYERKGSERKELVAAIEKITEEKAKYLGAPSMAYQIGAFTVTKDGAVESEDEEGLKQLTESLASDGIISAEQPEEETGLAISMPKDFFTNEALINLRKIIESKGTLMKAAFLTDELPVIDEGDKISFPWFTITTDQDLNAYSHFVSAICNMAKSQKRISAKEKEIENDKYAFRCFLLRLGFIGAEYKEERKVLLRNLTGSSAFKGGAKA